MNARPHLHLVSTDTGEVTHEDVCPGCVELSKKISVMAGKITRLENEQAEREGLSPDAGQIMEVLQFHKRLFPGGKIVRNGPAWKNVKARLADVDAVSGKPAFTVLSLRAAAVGLSMSDWHRAHRKTGAAFLYADPDRVLEMVGRAVEFKREFGVSALSIVDELGRGGYERLVDRCDCGHIRLEHEKENPALEIWHPACAVHGCACPGYQTAGLWEQLRWMAERDRELAGEDVA